jgi:hypothetical protein
VSSDDPDGDGGRDGGRADALFVLNLSPDLKNVAMIGIPRDTKVKKPAFYGQPDRADGSDYMKINAALNGTHYDRQVEAVERLLGIKVNGYILFDFNSTEKVISIAKSGLGIEKSLGGFLGTLTKPWAYKNVGLDDIHNSFLAIDGLLRKRSGDGLNAFIRDDTIGKFTAFLLERGVLFYHYNPDNDNEKGRKLISDVLEECETNMTLEKAVEIIGKFDPENLGKIEYFEVPGTGGQEAKNKPWYFVPETPTEGETLFESISGQKIMRSDL